jgi:hypothetical protein
MDSICAFTPRSTDSTCALSCLAFVPYFSSRGQEIVMPLLHSVAANYDTPTVPGGTDYDMIQGYVPYFIE